MARLTKEIDKAKERLERLSKAKEEYESLEQRVQVCRKSLKDVEAELATLYGLLGQVAFKAFIAGDIDEQPIFEDRLAVHKTVQELQQKLDRLKPGPGAGMIQKVKAKAQQLVVKGKITFEGLLVDEYESKIGRQLLETKSEESIRCDMTSDFLGQVTGHRESMAACTLELQEAEAGLTKVTDKLCEAVPLQHIESSKTFDAEMKTCKNTIGELESALSETESSMTDALAENDTNRRPQSLTGNIQDKRSTPKDARNPSALLYAEGNDGQIELFENKICIKRKGALGFINHGLTGDKNIMISAISSIQFKDAGVLVGYIQFAFMGGQEAKGGFFQSLYDENTVTFDKHQQPVFEQLRDEVEQRIEARHSSPSAPSIVVPATSDADEIAKLAELRDKNILTEEEFQQKKKQILGL